MLHIRNGVLKSCKIIFMFQLENGSRCLPAAVAAAMAAAGSAHFIHVCDIASAPRPQKLLDDVRWVNGCPCLAAHSHTHTGHVKIFALKMFGHKMFAVCWRMEFKFLCAPSTLHLHILIMSGSKLSLCGVNLCGVCWPL